MARLARVVVPGVPHPVTQRGDRRERMFFADDDFRACLARVSDAARRCGTVAWSCCVMANPVHFRLVPSEPEGLRKTPRRGASALHGRLNARFAWTGLLWQGRFNSTPMDERHACAALRCVALNPVRAKLVARAEDWPGDMECGDRSTILLLPRIRETMLLASYS